MLSSLGTGKAKKVRRSHVAEAVGNYTVFKNGVEKLFGKYEFGGSYRAMLRNYLQSGSESVAA